MAVPVVNHILPYGLEVGDPSEGPTSGRTLVEIFGRNFRLPPDPLETGPCGDIYSGIVVADEPRTVSVTFGGVEALEVDVISPIKLKVVTPISPLAATEVDNYGAGDVDVVVTNLDDDEVAIPGETVTVTDGFTYRHTKLDATNPSDLLRLVEILIHELKRQVLPEVVLTVHTEYDSDTSDGLNITDLAQLPAVMLLGPDTVENRFYSINERPEEEVENSVTEIRRKPRTVDLLFDLVVVSDFTMELLNLMSIMNDFVNRNPYLYMYKDPNDLSLGQVRYEFAFQANGDFKVSTKPSTSNIRSFTGAVVIRGFDIEGLAGFSEEAVRQRAKLLTGDITVNADLV
jgi:hypothetical protein